MTEGNNPTDRGQLGQAKRHVLTDKNGIPLSAAVISSASAHDIKAVTAAVIDNAVVIKQPMLFLFIIKRKRKHFINIYVLIEHIVLKQ